MQTVQTQIILLDEQSDQGLHCCNFLYIFRLSTAVKLCCLNLRVITSKYCVPAIFSILQDNEPF